MKFTLPKNALPAVELSEDQQNTFIDQADTIVKEIVAANDAFIADGGVLRDPRWRLVRTKEGMQVFRQRSKVKQRRRKSSTPVMESPSWSSSLAQSRYRAETSNHAESSMADRTTSVYSSSGIADDSIMEKIRPPGASLMGLHGTMDGTLDDCMFGCFAPNDEEWKLRSSHINDRLDDARIVVSIRDPTEEDPYRYLAIKWLAVEQPTVLSGIVQQRDFVVLEGSGFTRDSNGEKVGYFLVHSVALREVPELTHLGFVRGVMSFCYILRQSRPGKVDIYTRGFSDSRSDLLGRLSVAITTEAALCCMNLSEYAQIKKLMWLMKNNSRGRSRGATQSNRCEACEKKFSKFSLTSSRSGTACSVCRRMVCTKCSVLKKMVMDVSDTGSVQHCSLRFCLVCLLKAKDQCGWKVALSDFETASQSSQVSRTLLTPPSENFTRPGRSLSSVSDSRAYRRGDMTAKFHLANYTGDSALRSEVTQFSLASGDQFRQWPQRPDPRTKESQSARGIRPRMH